MCIGIIFMVHIPFKVRYLESGLDDAINAQPLTKSFEFQKLPNCLTNYAHQINILYFNSFSTT